MGANNFLLKNANHIYSMTNESYQNDDWNIDWYWNEFFQDDIDYVKDEIKNTIKKLLDNQNGVNVTDEDKRDNNNRNYEWKYFASIRFYNSEDVEIEIKLLVRNAYYDWVNFDYDYFVDWIEDDKDWIRSNLNDEETKLFDNIIDTIEKVYTENTIGLKKISQWSDGSAYYEKIK